jgi:broad specificity phosphatase PhoE
MSELLLIRHAETDMAGRFCGHSDPPVNQRGLGQIGELQQRLCNQRPTAIYTSDLQRAMTTARALADSLSCRPERSEVGGSASPPARQGGSAPCISCPALREIHFGSWEGLSWPQIEEQDAAYAATWLREFPRHPAPQGESFASFEQRVLTAVRSILSRHEGERVAVVTHAGVMRVILRRLCGVAEEAAWTLTESYCCTYLSSHSAQHQQTGQEVCR